MESTGFTVDLTDTNPFSLSQLVSQAVDDVTRQRKIEQRVAEIILPGYHYTIVDSEGDLVGEIGSKTTRLDIDGDEQIWTDGMSDVEACETEEQLDQFIEDLAVYEAIVQRIDHPNDGEDLSMWQSNPYEVATEWINEQREAIDEVRQSIRDEAEDLASTATGCNGFLDIATGTIKHHRGYPTCAIHGTM